MQEIKIVINPQILKSIHLATYQNKGRILVFRLMLVSIYNYVHNISEISNPKSNAILRQILFIKYVSSSSFVVVRIRPFSKIISDTIKFCIKICTIYIKWSIPRRLKRFKQSHSFKLLKLPSFLQKTQHRAWRSRKLNSSWNQPLHSANILTTTLSVLKEFNSRECF